MDGLMEKLCKQIGVADQFHANSVLFEVQIFIQAYHLYFKELHFPSLKAAWKKKHNS